MAKKQRSDNLSPRIENRRAWHDYHIDEKLECGVVLTGSEVKSIRAGQANLSNSYARVEPRTMELMLYDVDIAMYKQAGPHNHEPKRPRKLLAHRREIERLLGKTTAKGTTLVPLALYFVRGRVKVELGIARGKGAHDKRDSIKQRDAGKEIRRAMTRKVL